MLAYTSILLGPIYRLQGVQSSIRIGGTTYSPIRLLDKTAGETLAGPIQIETTKPAATARVADIRALGIASLDDLTNAIVTMNDKDWRVTSVKPMPSPRGENDGEVYMFLEGQ